MSLLRQFSFCYFFFSMMVGGLHAQAPTIDRVAQDHTLREAMRLSAPVKSSAAKPARTFSQEEIDLLDREFGNQTVTGVVQPQKNFVLMMEAGGTYTTNAALIQSPQISDWIARPGLRAAWVPSLTDKWSVMAITYYSLWRYADSRFLNFDDFGGQLGLFYQKGAGTLPGGLPTESGWLQYRYQRQMEPWNWGQAVFETHFAEVGLRKAWKIAPQTAAWLGANTAISLEGRPDLFRRHEHSFQAGTLWQASPKLSLTGLYRFAWFDTVDVDRDDLNHSLILGLNYQLNSRLRASLFTSGIFNHSNLNIFDYEVFNASAGASLILTW